MTTIRICEESEARLMIRDGSFREYVDMWSAQFPQKSAMTLIKDAHFKYGLNLGDSRTMAEAQGAYRDICFEVGDRVILKKRNDKIEVYRRVGEIWIGTDDLDILDSESLFDDMALCRFSLCSEGELLNAGSAAKLAKTIIERLWSFGAYGSWMPFGKHEIWELKDESSIQIHTDAPDNRSINKSETVIAKHIKRYREAHKITFGPF